MEAQFFGANCVRLVAKKASIVIDDNLAELGLKPITKAEDVELITDLKIKPQKARLVLNQPGEYEVSDVSINGIAARANMEEEGKKSATIYKIVIGDIKVAVLGHIYPELTEQQLEAIGIVDVLFVPVGGHGFTMDAIGALGLIKKIEPKIVVPTYYASTGINYEVPQAELDDVIKELGMEPKETVTKLKVKAGEMGEGTQLMIMEVA